MAKRQPYKGYVDYKDGEMPDIPSSPDGKTAMTPYLQALLRWLLGGIFVYASFHKIADPAGFAKILYGYGLFPGVFINLMAIAVPFLELLAGVGLLAGIWPRAAATVTAALLSGFIVALSINMLRGHQFDCGCFSFGARNHTTSVAGLLIRDIVYFSACFWLITSRLPQRWCLLPDDKDSS